jgi:hypothetical protein
LRQVVVGFGINEHRPHNGFFGFTVVGGDGSGREGGPFDRLRAASFDGAQGSLFGSR